MTARWTLETVVECDHCHKPMFPNVSLEDEDGVPWNCMTYGCGDWSGGEIEAEDLEALGVPTWIAERIAALSDAVLELEQ